MAPWGLLLLPREDAAPGDPVRQGRMGPPTLGVGFKRPKLHVGWSCVPGGSCPLGLSLPH